MKWFGFMTGSLVATSWFCAIALFALSLLTYVQSNGLHRKYRMFHWLTVGVCFTSAIFFLMLATTGFGSSIVGNMQMYWILPLMFGVTVPMMLVTLALFAGCSILEARMLGSAAMLQYVCWVFLMFQSMEGSVLESNNRWVWWIVQLLTWIPIGTALFGGLKTPAIYDEALTNKVGRLCSIILLYYVVQQVFLFFTHAVRLISPSTEAMGLLVTHFIVVMIFGISMVNDTDVIERTINSNAGLQLLSGAYEDVGVEGETSTMHRYDLSSGAGVEGASRVYRQETTILKPSRSGGLSVSEKQPLKGPQQV